MTAAKKSSKPRSTTPAAPVAKSPRGKPIPTEPPKQARAEYAALLREMNDAKSDEVRGWDRRWEAIATVLQKSYYLLDDDAPTAAQWILKHTGESYRTGTRNARVARFASPDEELLYGATKLDLAITIELAKHNEKHPNGPALTNIDFAKLRYAVKGKAQNKASNKSGNKKNSVSLKDITVDELHAIAFPKAKGESAPQPLSASGEVVRVQLSKEKTLRNVTVSEHDNQLSFTGVRFDQLAAFGRAVAGTKLP